MSSNPRVAATAKPLQWSVDWREIVDRILATYPIKVAPKGFTVSSPYGGLSGAHSYKDAVLWAVDDFTERLIQVASRARPPRQAGETLGFDQQMDRLGSEVVADLQGKFASGARMRNAFYSTADGLSALGYVSDTDYREDRQLRQLIAQLSKSLSLVKRHLDSNYNWD